MEVPSNRPLSYLACPDPICTSTSSIVDETERWLPISGFPGYEVSSLGRVRTWRDFRGNPFGRKTPHILKLRRNKKRGNYLSIDLIRDRKYHRKLVHSLVLVAFVGPKPEGMECRHLDGDSGNAKLSNLAWGTPTQNHADKRCHGTSNAGARNPMAKLTAQDVKSIRELSKSGLSQRLIGNRFGISQAAVSNVISGIRWADVT